MRIVVGADGSASSLRALNWCAEYGAALQAEVVVVYAFESPAYDEAAMRHYFPLSLFSDEDRAQLREHIEHDWCAALDAAGVPYRVVAVDGQTAAAAIRSVADEENADLVVTGRRGLGGFAELLLGSTSQHLVHHVGRPLVIVS